MPSRWSSRRPLRSFLPPPPPGTGTDRLGAEPAGEVRPAEGPLTRLPYANVGALPGAPPGVVRGAPQLGGIRGVGAPPEIRRRVPGGVRAAPEAGEVLARIRRALRKAERKVLHSRQKLEGAIAEVRKELASRL